MGCVMSMRPASGFRKRTFRRAPSSSHSTVSPRSNARTTRTYSRSSESFIGPRPIVLRAVKPVLTPNTTRPGASRLSDASALAATGAIRFEGTSTPVPSTIFDVRAAASAIATNTSAQSICVS